MEGARTGRRTTNDENWEALAAHLNVQIDSLQLNCLTFKSFIFIFFRVLLSFGTKPKSRIHLCKRIMSINCIHAQSISNGCYLCSVIFQFTSQSNQFSVGIPVFRLRFCCCAWPHFVCKKKSAVWLAWKYVDGELFVFWRRECVQRRKMTKEKGAHSRTPRERDADQFSVLFR